MSKVIQFELPVSESVKDYLKDAALPDGCSFDSPIWRTDAWGTHRNLPEIFNFLKAGIRPKENNHPLEDYLPEPWFSTCQAMVVWLHRSQNLKAGRITGILSPAKGFISFWSSNPQPCFSPAQLQSRHFTQYEDFLKQRVKINDLTTAGARFSALGVEKFALFLNHFEITQNRIIYNQTFKRPTSSFEYKIIRKDSSDETKQNEMVHKTKLLELDILFALGNLFETVEDKIDRFFLATTLLLAVTGFRVSELLSLRENCFYEYEHQSEILAEIRYDAEKNGLSYAKQIPVSAVSYVKDCLTVIRDFTANGRTAAKQIAEQNTVIPLQHEIRLKPVVKTDELAKVLQIPRDSIAALFKRLKIPISGRGANNEFLYETVKAMKALDFNYLAARTARIINYEPVVRKLKDGTSIKLHEALFVICMHETSLDYSTLFFLPRNVSVASYGKWLEKVCEKYDIRDSFDNQIQINSHKFRHLLNTMYVRGGLTDEEIARIFGRKDIKQNRAYNQLSPREKRLQIADDIRQGKTVGVVTDTYDDLKLISLEEAEQFLESVIEAVHFTEFGSCVLDWARQPCPHHLNCVTGRDGKSCRHLVVKKGDERSLVQIETLLRNTKKSLEVAEQSESHYLSDWINHNTVLIINLEELKQIHLAAIGDGTVGEIVAPFPGGATREAIIAAKDFAEMQTMEKGL